MPTRFMLHPRLGMWPAFLLPRAMLHMASVTIQP